MRVHRSTRPRRSVALAAALGLCACTASCTWLVDLSGLTDGCDGGCGRQQDDAGDGDGDVDGSTDGRTSDAGAAPGCACADRAPSPWQGPVALWEGTGAPPSCPGAYGADVLDAFADPVAPPASCTCACDPPAGASCASSWSATLYDDHACTTPCGATTLTLGACADVQGTCANVYGLSATAQATGGACAPRATTQRPGWSWSRAARACAPTELAGTNACGAGQICAPAPAAPLEPTLCIVAAGDLACPAGAYSVRRVYYGDAADGRGCAPCTCGAPSGVTCTATAQQGCGQTGPSIPLPTPCVSLEDPGSVELTASATPTGGSCSPSGGEPTGALTPTAPTTVCCTP